MECDRIEERYHAIERYHEGLIRVIDSDTETTCQIYFFTLGFRVLHVEVLTKIKFEYTSTKICEQKMISSGRQSHRLGLWKAHPIHPHTTPFPRFRHHTYGIGVSAALIRH